MTSPPATGTSGFARNPRRASETPFYKLVAGHFGEFKRVYSEKYERDLEKGFARVQCGDCGHEMFVAFSCDRPDGGNVASAMDGAGATKQRGFCPSCHQKRMLNLSFHLSADVCARVPHRQFVVTIEGVYLPLPVIPAGVFLKVWEQSSSLQNPGLRST